MLASPRYGERWGRHWLDAARYAHSNGFTIDGPRTMWPYRDWVIDAINAEDFCVTARINDTGDGMAVAARRGIPLEDMEARGYGAYLGAVTGGEGG